MPLLQAASGDRPPPMIYSLLGQAHEQLGNRPAAIAAYLRFIELRPDLPEAARLRRRVAFLGGHAPTQ